MLQDCPRYDVLLYVLCIQDLLIYILILDYYFILLVLCITAFFKILGESLVQVTRENIFRQVILHLNGVRQMYSYTNEAADLHFRDKVSVILKKKLFIFQMVVAGGRRFIRNFFIIAIVLTVLIIIFTPQRMSPLPKQGNLLCLIFHTYTFMYEPPTLQVKPYTTILIIHNILVGGGTIGNPFRS